MIHASSAADPAEAAASTPHNLYATNPTANPIELKCVGRKPNEQKITKRSCRSAMNRFVRESCRGQSDYIFTKDERHLEDPDYITLPQLSLEGSCSVVLEFPSDQPDTALPVIHIPTMLRYFNELVEGCLESAEADDNGAGF